MPYNVEPDSQVTQTPDMTTPILRLFAIAAAICLAATSAAGDSPDRTLFTNVHVFNGMDGERLENANVLVEGNLIKAVSTDAIGVPGAEIIDGGGRTLMPGLIDSHVHFSAYTPIAIQARQNVNEFMVGALATVRGEAMLMRGFTTVRDTGGPSTYLRKLFDANLAPGPRVYGAEAMITQTGGHGDFRGADQREPPIRRWPPALVRAAPGLHRRRAARVRAGGTGELSQRCRLLQGLCQRRRLE